MLFWMACEELKSEQQNPLIVEEKARLIYEDYISILSPKEVSRHSLAFHSVKLKTKQKNKYYFVFFRF